MAPSSNYSNYSKRLQSEQALAQAQAQGASNATQQRALEAQVARAKNNVQQLSDAASGLEQSLIERQRAAISAAQAQLVMMK